VRLPPGKALDDISILHRTSGSARGDSGPIRDRDDGGGPEAVTFEQPAGGLHDGQLSGSLDGARQPDASYGLLTSVIECSKLSLQPD
jgi:hypothetical protein